MQNDWRLVNQNSYLQGKHLVKARFVPTAQCDHAHCAFCWDKFGPDPAWLQHGYVTADNRRWICEQCFLDFKDQFDWTVQSNEEQENA